ncbi:MAG: radical SAM protein [Bifidobacteriaceae bacterium]|jgi:hypothetical protein|nr:radical SAM protein [Bifidobacteriaceae bacterium]
MATRTSIVSDLAPTQELKLRLLAEGMSVTARAAKRLDDAVRELGWSAADYASTSGLILRLEDDVWVNAPVRRNNPNFVRSDAVIKLDADSGGFVVDAGGSGSRAAYCPQAAYHGGAGGHGPLNNFVFTHADRVRLSPLRSCAMVCEFCNIPYDDPIGTYALKPIEGCLEALDIALADQAQPARHVLISGGTPKPKDVGFHRELFRRVLAHLPGVDVDIMMVPLRGVFDLGELEAGGVHELSINLEVYSRERAKQVARHKFNQGLGLYLGFIDRAVARLGPGRVRSMLMVGLEPVEDTLAGVEELARRGATPVLSPFRPDPATPLRDVPPPTFAELAEVYSRAMEIARRHGVSLGPACPPCTHNTLSFAQDSAGAVRYLYPGPVLVR